MTKKQRLTLIIVAVLLVAGIATAAILQRGQTAPSNSTSEQNNDAASDNPAKPTDEEGSHEELGVDTHSHDIPDLVVNEKVTTAAEVEATYKPMAEKAAREYVFQQTDESSAARQKRLRAVFTSDSPVINAPAPKVDTSNSPKITANPIVLNSQWQLSGDTLLFTVSLRVITRSDNPPYDEVSDVYQAYDVRFARINDSYKPQTIVFSRKPVIINR